MHKVLKEIYTQAVAAIVFSSDPVKRVSDEPLHSMGTRRLTSKNPVMKFDGSLLSPLKFSPLK